MAYSYVSTGVIPALNVGVIAATRGCNSSSAFRRAEIIAGIGEKRAHFLGTPYR